MNFLLFLVKSDLFLYENAFEKLRDFIANPNILSQLYPNFYNIIEFSTQNGDIKCYHSEFWFFEECQNSVNKYINSGYILMDYATLKSMCCL